MALTKVRGSMVNMADLDLSNVGAIQADSIAGDADTNTSITFSGSDVITIANAGTNQLTFNDGSIVPVADNDIDLGTSVLEFKNAYFDGTVTSDAFAGPLTGAVTGNADTATALANARTIGGTSFDGTANIVPGTATLATTATVSDSTANTNFPVVFHNESNGLLDDTGALRYNPSTGTLLAPNLVVAGTTTTANTVTMEAQNAVIFEGATADNYETTLSIVDPTADHTQYLINQGGYIPVLAAATTTAITSTPAELNLLDGVSGLVQADFTKLAAVDSTAAELNIVDGGTSATSTTLADADRLVVNDNGTMVQVALTDLETYMETSLDTLSNVTSVGTLTGLAVSGNQTIGGTLGVTGVISPTTHIDMPDNATIKLGTGDDFQVVHDGSHTHLTNSTGNLRILGDTIEINDAANSESMISAVKDGAVSLYYDNVKKFETRSLGAGITTTGGSNNPGLLITNSGNAIWQHGVQVLAASHGTGKEIAGIAVGTVWSAYNAAKFGFYHAGTGSTANLATIGFHSTDYPLTVSAAGNVAIGKGTTAATYDLDVDGDINFTGTLREDGSAFSSGATTVDGLTTATVSSSDPATNTNPSAAGHVWFNSSSGEAYICTSATSNANTWTNIGDGAGHISTATGGNSITNVTISGQAYRVHVFTSTGNFVCGALDDIDILMVAGGGSGGNRHGGGGGGGGLIEITDTTFTAGTYVCTIGAGGARKVGSGAGVDGGDSTIVCAANSVSITATGGGGGGGLGDTAGRTGGSGGGAGPYYNNASNGRGSASQSTPSMTGLTGGSGAGYAYRGGGNPGNHAGGGGGGAGAVGGPSIDQAAGEDSDQGGVGGAGRQNNIDGNNYYYAAGGGGAGRRAYHGGAGGIGGGGGGGAENLHSGTHGVGGGSARNAGANAADDLAGSAGANTGSGGGGHAQTGTEGYGSDTESGAGGSGIIIIRYEV